MSQSLAAVPLQYIFSFWIVGWLIIYMLSIYTTPKSPQTKWFYENANPIYVFYLGLVENLANLLLIFAVNPQINVIAKFSLVIIIMKLIPIYLLRNAPTNPYYNIAIFIAVFAIYNIYLWLENQNILDIYKKIIQNTLEGGDATPMTRIINHITNFVLISIRG